MKKILLFFICCIFAFAFPNLVDAETPKTLTLMSYNCEIVRTDKEVEKRNNAFYDLCSAMGTNPINYAEGRNKINNYIKDNNIDRNSLFSKHNLIIYGKNVNADYVVYVEVKANHFYGSASMFHTSIKMDADINLRIINVNTGEEMLTEYSAVTGKRDKLLPCFIETVEKAKADIKLKNILFSKN